MKTKSNKFADKLALVKTKIPSTKEAISLPFQKYIIIVVIVNLLIIGGSFLIQRWLPPEIPLYYGQIQGNKQLAPSLAIAVPALVSLIILCVNLIISQLVESPFFRKILIITAVSLSILSLITTIKIITLVGSFSL